MIQSLLSACRASFNSIAPGTAQVSQRRLLLRCCGPVAQLSTTVRNSMGDVDCHSARLSRVLLRASASAQGSRTSTVRLVLPLSWRRR
ncbi:hypothetical protein D3C78_1400730 [compost metagenome]